jgi:hypothetical protein
MKRFLLLITLLSMMPITLAAQNRGRDEGVIVRMRMTDCVASHHAFMTAVGGPQQATNDQCPEYVLVTNKVVYVIVAKDSEQLVPLAESTRFHFQKNEVLIRLDDARRESHFHVKAMTLRPEWEREQQISDAEALIAAHRLEGATTLISNQQ